MDNKSISQSIEHVVRPLIELTRPLSKKEVVKMLLEVAQHTAELSTFEHFTNVHYTRNRVFQSDHVDLLVLCWKPTQRTPIHDHTGSTCGVCVLKGEATEVAFHPTVAGLLIPGETKTLRTGEITVSIDSEAHLVGNFGAREDDLVTLHCYSPPLAKMKIFSEQDTFFANYNNIVSSAMTSGFYAPKT